MSRSTKALFERIKMTTLFRPAVLLSSVLTCLASDYYISKGGADTNDGHSPSSPWLSLNNSYLRPFASGDRILLQRGDVWTDEPLLLSMVNGISIDAYGNVTIPRPRLVISRNANSQRAFCLHPVNCNNLTIQNLHLTG
jgi:hypothetical protein